jgi:hypothetical protein
MNAISFTIIISIIVILHAQMPKKIVWRGRNLIKLNIYLEIAVMNELCRLSKKERATANVAI